MKNWLLASHTGVAGGSMAASSPRIRSLEHSENTCSWRGTWGSLLSVSLTMSDAGELTVPSPDSGKKHTRLTQLAKVIMTNKQVHAVISLVEVTSVLTSHHRREGVLAGHRRCLTEAGRVQGVLSNQLSFLPFSSAWGG